jgi:hypothetical protein
VAAADGPALADPALRRAIDAARPHVAPAFGCVIDAALASDEVALAASRTVGATVVIASAAEPHCPALSRIGDDLWIATTGDATAAPASEASPQSVSRWGRARDYLQTAPVAVAIDLGSVHAVAAAQPNPLEAWLAVDATAEAADTFEQRAKPFALYKLDLARTGNQIVVRTNHYAPDDLALLVPALFTALDPAPVIPAKDPLPCPREVLRCTDATHFEVVSIPDFFAFLAAPGEPVVAAGQVIGLRLTGDSGTFLKKGDIVLGVDGRPVRSADEWRAQGKLPRHELVLAFRRDGADRVVHISAHQ